MLFIDPEELLLWPKPNYIDPETQIVTTVVCGVVCILLSTFFVVGRCWGRIMMHAFGADDWMMVFAWILSTTMMILQCIGTRVGIGYHVWDAPFSWLVPALQISLVEEVLFAGPAGLTKISLCITYLRLFPTNVNRYFCYTAISFTSCWMAVSIFATLFQCRPIHKYWDLFDNTGCIDARSLLVSLAAVNSLGNLVIFLWPARFLWSMNMPQKQRIFLTITFSIGCLVSVVGLGRMGVFVIFFKSPDIAWNGATLLIVTSFEIALGIICACLPGMKPLLARFGPSIFRTKEPINRQSWQNRPENMNMKQDIERAEDERWADPKTPARALSPTGQSAKEITDNESEEWVLRPLVPPESGNIDVHIGAWPPPPRVYDGYSTRE